MEIKNVIYMLMAQDMDRAIKFYRDALGFSVQFQSPGWTQMTFDNSTVALHGGWTGGRNKTGLGFQVTDIDKPAKKPNWPVQRSRRPPWTGQARESN